MAFSDFRALWLHRYKKYSYILIQTLYAYIDVLKFWWLKKTSGKQIIALIRTEHFGDIVAAEPIISQVRKIHPKAHLVWFVRPVFKELVQNHPELDSVWLQSSVLSRIIICNSGVFDKIYNMEFWQSNFDTVTGKIHENSIAAQKGITVHNYFDKGNLLKIFQLVADLEVQDTDAPKILISDSDRQFVDGLSLPSKMVVLHCNSNFSPKDWNIANWEKLIIHLIEKHGFTVVEVGLKSKNNVSNSQYFNLCGRLSILQTAEVIRRANYFIGIDSGPAHLANAVGTFGILLIGRLNEFVNQMPYSGTYQSGENAVIIRQGKRTCAEMDYEEVEAIIDDTFIK